MKKVKDSDAKAKAPPAGSVELDEQQLDVSGGASAPSPPMLVLGKGPVPTYKAP